MTDGRKVLRADAPHGRHDKLVQARIDASTYERLYFMAERQNTSIASLIVQAITLMIQPRPQVMTPRDLFNQAVVELGLQVVRTSSDGWHQSFVRTEDGMHLWRVTDHRYGCGIMTAWIDEGGLYAEHCGFYRTDGYIAALRDAVERQRGVPVGTNKGDPQ